MEMFTISQFRSSSLAEKNTMSLNQSKSNNFFSGLYEDNGFMIVYSIFNLCVTLTSPVLLYSICWYERHSADLRFRTLINQLLSHVCFASLLGSFVARIPHVLMLYLGPTTMPFCSFSLLMGRYFFLLVIGELLTRQTIKFFYIFKWKHIVSLNDDFAAFFLTLNNSVLFAIFSFSIYFRGFLTAEVEYHVCTGKDPAENIPQAFQYKTVGGELSNVTARTYEEVTKQDPMNAAIILMLSVITVEAFMIWLYGKQPLLKRAFSNRIQSLPNEGIHSIQTIEKNPKFEETKHVIISNGGVLVVAAVGLLLLTPLVLTKEVMKRNPEDLNHGYGKAFFLVGRFTMPLLSYYLIPLVAISGNRKMRKTLCREFFNRVQNCFP